MGNILSRIQEIALNEGITIGALERKIGASKGVLSRAINNGTDIQSKWLQTVVENYPIYSTRWLLTGEGSMLRSDEPQPSVMSVSESNSDNSFIYTLYKEKESEIKELNAQMLKMSEEIGRLKAKLGEEKSYVEGLKSKVAKDVSIKKSSSQSIHNVPFADVPLKKR